MPRQPRFNTPPPLPKTVRYWLISASIVFCLVYLGIRWSGAYLTTGIIRGNIPWMSYGIIWALLRAALWLGATGTLAYALHGLIGRNRERLIAGFAMTAILTMTIFITDYGNEACTRWAELRDIESIGLKKLRAEARALSELNALQQYPWRWFGGEVPAENLPDGIRKLSERAAYVTADTNGVVIVTDGLGSWRGGYMITSTDSSFVPENSRQITAGVFYVFSHP